MSKPKPKRYISRTVLRTELSFAADLIAAMNFGEARRILGIALARVNEYDLPGGSQIPPLCSVCGSHHTAYVRAVECDTCKTLAEAEGK